MVRNTIRRLIEDGKLSTWLDEDEHAESFEAICSALSASPEAPSLSAAVPASGGVEAVARLAYGYELMHTALCHIAGTSGADRHWYVHKAQEVTARITRVGEVTKESNPGKPGDCLRGHRQFVASLSPAPTSGSEAGGEAVTEIETVRRSREYWRGIADEWAARAEELRIERDALRADVARALSLAKPASEPADGAVRDRDIARWKRDSELLSAIQDECWDVRFTDTPNADAGDYNVNIEIVGHFMAEPQERVVGENYNEDLRAALEQAMTAEPYPPARPVYDERAALSAPASSSPAEAEAREERT